MTAVDVLGKLMRFVRLPGRLHDSLGAEPLLEGLAITAPIADKGFDNDCEQGLELRAVACPTAREVRGQRQALKVGPEVDLGGEAAARAPKRLTILLP